MVDSTPARGHVGGGRFTHGAPQDGVDAPRGVQLAGHEGVEMRDAATAGVDPFGMRTGQADQHAVGRVRVGCAGLVAHPAEDLRLFAAHDVG
ncbi:hypothetical protein G6F50_018302 [Rhizopus delemar]|uniref:Uncharacterized protein n=1 Tax=Rhizopus delemar TaxID=936053 RepID=A0A9P6XMM1_9FUNG|nr:hypothetical protein G6F50_018302 [Rhizopus delemar]